jgi:hypothetical protein
MMELSNPKKYDYLNYLKVKEEYHQKNDKF